MGSHAADIGRPSFGSADHARAGAETSVARELRPKGRFQPEVFPRYHCAAVGQVTARLRHHAIQRRHGVGEHGKHQMMAAHDEDVRSQLIGRFHQPLNLGVSLVVGSNHLILLARQNPVRLGLSQEAKTLGEREVYGTESRRLN